MNVGAIVSTGSAVRGVGRSVRSTSDASLQLAIGEPSSAIVAADTGSASWVYHIGETCACDVAGTTVTSIRLQAGLATIGDIAIAISEVGRTNDVANTTRASGLRRDSGKLLTIGIAITAVGNISESVGLTSKTCGAVSKASIT